MLEHFGYPCNIKEDKPLMICPRCGEEIFEEDKPFFCDMDNDVIGCENCITQRTICKQMIGEE